jgi:hypothetical protein
MNAPTTPPPTALSSSVKWFLFLSVALNLLLVLHLAAVRSNAPGSTQTAPISNPVRPKTSIPEPDPSRSEGSGWDWLSVSTWDLTTLNNRLVQAGCPEHTREAIVEAALDQEYRHRKWQLFARVHANFWERVAVTKTSRGTPSTPEIQQAEAELGQLYQAANAKSQALLGRRYDGPRRHWDRPDSAEEPHADFLSESQRQRLAAQEQEVARLRETLRSQGIPSQEEDAQVKALKAQHDLEQRPFMTEDEAGEYRARTSRFGYVLQHLYGFEPTARERQEIIRVYEAHDGRVPPAELEAVIGPERAKEFNRARDQSYAFIYRVSAGLGLGEEHATRVYELKQQVEIQAQSIRHTPGLGVGKRSELLRTLEQETLTSLDNQFGTAGRDLYLKNGGWWVKDLARETQ